MEGVGRRPCEIEERWILSICSGLSACAILASSFPFLLPRLLSSSRSHSIARLHTLERHASFSHPLSRFRSACTCFSPSRGAGEGAHYGRTEYPPVNRASN